MAAWNEIKNIITQDRKYGSIGYLKQLNIGCDIFRSILPYIENKEVEKIIFDLDSDVREAILYRLGLKEYGKE